MIELQRVVDALVAAGAPGALAELRDEDGTRACASGVASLDDPRPVAPGGWFRIGSVTKTFTATVILQLAGQGVIGLADSVERWLPGLVPGGDRITLRQLLDHSGGLHNYTDDLDAARPAHRFRRWSPREVVALATERAPLFAPGTSRAYCNTGYILLGMVIEQATGNTYANAVADRIVRPLGLHGTSVPDGTSLPEPHAHGYLPVAGALVDVTEFDPSQAWSAGGIISTAADLNRFFAALLTGDVLRSAELRTMLDEGLGLDPVKNPTVCGKTGGFHGFHTISFHTKDAKRQLTVSTTSAANRPLATEEILTHVFGLV